MEENKKKSNGKLKKVIIACLIALALIALFIFNAFFPLKYLLCYFVKKSHAAAEGEAFVRFINVGYGDCAIIQFPDGKNLLIDSGNGSYSNDFKIIKELNKCGIDKIDYAICTNIKEEHVNGFEDVFKLKSVDKFFCPYLPKNIESQKLYSAKIRAKEHGAEIIYNEYGAGAIGENYFFTMLSPTSYKSSESEYEEMRKNPTDTNVCNTSAVVWINIYDTNFLFLSDVSSSVLKKIANSYLINQSGYCPMGEKFVNLEKCDVLKVSDHGHMRGANTQFHSLIKPDHAVICAGKNSREDCPSAKVIADLTLNASVYITENYGDVTFKITNTNYFLIKE